MNRLMLLTGLVIVALFPVAWGQATEDAAECVGIVDADARLQCYDQAARHSSAQEEVTPAPAIWHDRILQDAARDTFTLTARRPIYIMYSSLASINREPYESLGEGDELDNDEIKFQLSAQSKLADNLFADNGDLWFSYTQVAYWQLFNSDISAPFRETNYEPEVYLSFLTNYSLFGLTGSVVNLGVTHQSNGRSEPLSRSWNRAYMDFVFDRDNLMLRFRPWVRFSEDEEDDDNPDIEDYLGHYELHAAYAWNGHLFSTLLRNVFDNQHRYNAELQWSFPMSGHMRGLLQWYNGYGENLIDYNHRNNRIGIGVMMTDWL